MDSRAFPGFENTLVVIMMRNTTHFKRGLGRKRVSPWSSLVGVSSIEELDFISHS